LLRSFKSRMLYHCLIWIILLNSHLKFVCWNWNYPFILFVLKVLFPFLHVARRRQNLTIRSSIETAREDNKSDVEFGSLNILWVWRSSKSDGVFWVGWSSEFDEILQLLSRILSSNPRSWLLADLSSDLLP